MYFCTQEDGQTQIRIMYDNGDSDLVTSDSPPIEIIEDGLFIRPCWAKYGYRTQPSSGGGFDLILWIDFFELPTGWTHSRFTEARMNNEVRIEEIFNSNGLLTKTYFFQNQQILSVFGAVSSYFRDDFLFIDNIQIYRSWESGDVTVPPAKWNPLTGNFSPVNNGSFTLYIYDDTGKQIYESNPNKGAYVYDVSCGDCDNLTQLKVGDDSSTGYQCLPYKNLIEWAKQQRQKLKKI